MFYRISMWCMFLSCESSKIIALTLPRKKKWALDIQASQAQESNNYLMPLLENWQRWQFQFLIGGANGGYLRISNYIQLSCPSGDAALWFVDMVNQESGMNLDDSLHPLYFVPKRQNQWVLRWMNSMLSESIGKNMIRFIPKASVLVASRS